MNEERGGADVPSGFFMGGFMGGLEEDLCDFCHTLVAVADVPSGFFMDPICQRCLDYRTEHYPERAPAVRRSA